MSLIKSFLWLNSVKRNKNKKCSSAFKRKHLLRGCRFRVSIWNNASETNVTCAKMPLVQKYRSCLRETTEKQVDSAKSHRWKSKIPFNSASTNNFNVWKSHLCKSNQVCKSFDCGQNALVKNFKTTFTAISKIILFLI